LEPVRWADDWPIMGDATADATVGQPVATWPIPNHPGKNSEQRPQTSDEFSEKTLAPQWEWNHNPVDANWSLTARPGYLRLTPGYAADLFTARNTLTQMMQDESFEFTTRLDLRDMKDGDHAGLAMFEQAASGVEVVQSGDARSLDFFHAHDAITAATPLTVAVVQLRVHVDVDTATYFYSIDEGKTFQQIASPVRIGFSWWKGSRPSLFAYTTGQNSNSGHVDFDWAHYKPIEQALP